jgi:N-sulfoglucosamine sulfohydrolase
MRSLLLTLVLVTSPLFASERPNIVWIVGEDMGPEVRCFGDAQAITPNMDRLASEGARFTRCFTHAPVCAPSRHGLITGQYPIKTGAHHMRSVLVDPPTTFTRHLRDAGYHVSWPGKTDFNFKEPADFANSRDQWWKQDKPLPEPFFAYANFTESHESQVRNDGGNAGDRVAKLPKEQRRNPGDMKLPPFWPDTPEVRTELARYYDLVTVVDNQVGSVLDWIEKQGFTKNTVVIFFGDHGRGMPRFKRWCYDSGLHTALIVRWPGQIQPGSVREDLVEFLDFPATSLALAGVKVPESFDGQVFLGPNAAPPRKYAHAARDYMDETYDRIRSVRDSRHRYVRNFHPELPYAQVISYMEIGRTMQAWRTAHGEGKLNPVQSLFFAERKPAEELYDCETDPWQINNLAADPRYAGKLAELRAACDAWLEKTADKGAIPVEELVAQKIIHPRDANYDKRRRDGPAALNIKSGN